MKSVGPTDLREPADVDKYCRVNHISPSDSSTAVTPPSHPFHIIHLTSQPEKFIGVVTLLHHRPNRPDLGFGLLEPFAGKGYATEAAAAVLR